MHRGGAWCSGVGRNSSRVLRERSDARCLLASTVSGKVKVFAFSVVSRAGLSPPGRVVDQPSRLLGKS